MKIKHFLQLIRYKNLLMLVFMIILFKFLFFNTIPSFEIKNLILLILAITNITAYGNIINDYFDVETDNINKPEKVIIGKLLTKKKALLISIIFALLGIFFGLYLSYINDKLPYSLIFIITIAILYFYSKYLKRIALLGNLIVSLLIPFSIYLVFLFSKSHISLEEYSNYKIFLFYIFFAFILNFIREIVKDIEDMKGDANQNMKTLPIIIGKKRTQNVVFTLTLIPLFLSVYFAFIHFKNQYIIALYILFLIILPLGYFMYKILKINSKKEFHNLSILLKIIMFLGMLSILLITK